MGDINLPISGQVFAKSTGVTAVAADRIADYDGAASFNIAVESAIAYGQNFWPQEVALVQMNVSLNYGGVYWNMENIAAALLGISATAGTIKDTTAASASIIKMTNSLSTIPSWEFLSEVERSSDSKLFQVWAAAGRLATDLNMSLSKDEFMTTEMGIGCFADGSGDVIWLIQEN